MKNAVEVEGKYLSFDCGLMQDEARIKFMVNITVNLVLVFVKHHQLERPRAVLRDS